MSTWPLWHLLGGAPYTPSYSTDLRALFARVRMHQEMERIARERREADERESANEGEADGR